MLESLEMGDQDDGRLSRISLFNETASVKVEDELIINGSSTGISNLNSTKYEWAIPLYRKMLSNHWIPEKVSLQEDKVTIKELSEHEDAANRDTLSFLIFLDSFQGNNLPNIRRFITSPSVANLISIQEFQETVHQQSYQYGLNELYPHFTREKIYNRWRDNPILKKRIKFISSIGEAFEKNPNLENFKRVIIANYILEGVLFYSGFNFYDQLASRGKLVQFSKMIDYIRTDELTHMGIFINIFKEIFDKSDHDMVYDMFRQGAEQEIEWCHDTYGNRILGVSESSSEKFVHWLVNNRLNRIQLAPLFPDVTNPYAHLADNTNTGTKRENFFETTVTEYSKSESVSGWNDF